MGLGGAYRDVGRLEDSLAEYQEGVRLSRGGPFYVGEVGATYMRLNRLEEAKVVIKTAIEQKVETPRMHAILYQIAFIEGDAQAAQREFELSRPTAAARVANQAETAAFNGRLKDVRKLFRQTANSPQSGTTDRLGAAVNLASLASLEALFGNEAEARRVVRDALRLSPLEPAAAPFGYLMNVALTGHDESLEALEQLAGKAPQDTVLNSIAIPTARAALEIRTGDPAKAIALLDAAKPFEPGPASLRAIYMRGQAYLRAMVRPRSRRRISKDTRPPRRRPVVRALPAVSSRSRPRLRPHRRVAEGPEILPGLLAPSGKTPTPISPSSFRQNEEYAGLN